MTVAELIERLKTFPPDAPVIYRACSDWCAMDAADVDIVYKEGAAERVAAAVEKYKYPPNDCGAVLYRGGRYCNAYDPAYFPPGEQPEYVTAVTFPGN